MRCWAYVRLTAAIDDDCGDAILRPGTYGWLTAIMAGAPQAPVRPAVTGQTAWTPRLAREPCTTATSLDGWRPRMAASRRKILSFPDQPVEFGHRQVHVPHHAERGGQLKVTDR